MTELEFEKACRGPLAAVSGEYAWGTATVAGSAYTLNDVGTASEGIATSYSTMVGNAMYTTTNVSGNEGPLRVGIFAANGMNSGRVSSGASYWGIMELSGNMWERPITIGNAEGRAFTGTHGDGVLTSDGDGDAPTWPGTEAVGAGTAGGGWQNDASSMRVSDRYYNSVNSTFITRDNNLGGFRAVRH
jgi:formylglycine-generating enzyme required for sulfatase activity